MALTLVLAALAVYRLATDFAWMDGPFGIYADLRGRVLMRFGKDHWVTEGVNCPICWSFWLALPAGLLIDLGPMGFLYWLAIAGAAALMVRLQHDE